MCLTETGQCGMCACVDAVGLAALPLTFRSHDVYDQVVARRLECASVIGGNLQHNRGESLSPDQRSLYDSGPSGRG